MSSDAKLVRLGQVSLFADADRRHLERIAQLCTEVRVPAGKVLCREGEPGREFFVLVEGEAVVTANGREVATIGTGDFFGELALLDDGGVRNATVTTSTPAQLLVLSASEFHGLLESEPTVAVRMLPAIARRLRPVAQEQARTPVV